MHAALVTSFDDAPHYSDAPDPAADRPEQIMLDVLAAALHPRVRSQANGAHYTTTGALPLIPGVDGVGRDSDGALRYFVTEEGAMAERIAIDRRASVILDPSLDPVVVAAAMNPAMSSWIALTRRITLPDAAHVLIVGAAGNAGRLAIEVSRHLGAARVSAVARDTTRFSELTELGADDVLTFEEVSRASEADVVLDYVWGSPAGRAMGAFVGSRADRAKPVAWVQIGSVAGAEAPIPSAALRSSALQLVGSGQGSVSTRDIIAELPLLAAFVTSKSAHVTARAIPLADITGAWTAPSRERIVFIP
ncbi:zinc-binding alcohol dehydrogenase family protein [Herbiconiux sp. VKM Ac-2851]|uniref:quinone oxidoreductase family protein n=1 Tax=Herbiconiux sp. VKM Ac-2851 TaxID=2739025 RepID=UPI001564198C|nr:zinc-binding alcohol dehydrogenase family protein [Herbiconiux sp. VKM Ac-2851]NQX35712.1 zinc-binding alcohol dehydrogenase family protein [Herbiconiux sp. VKM Ac-2851]